MLCAAIVVGCASSEDSANMSLLPDASVTDAGSDGAGDAADANTRQPPESLFGVDQGMWPHNAIPFAAINASHPEFALDEAKVATIRQNSVWLDSCSAGFVSADGLIATALHCIYDCAASVAVGDKTALDVGFKAASPAEEKVCKDQKALVLEKVEDVSSVALAGMQGVAETDRPARIKANMQPWIDACTAAYPKESYRCTYKVHFGGAEVVAYRYRMYSAVRLSAMLPRDVAKFGKETDNFRFPRHSNDFALLRVYENGAPLSGVSHFKMNDAPVSAEQGIMVSGHPASTDRGYSYQQVLYTQEKRYGDFAARNQALATALKNLASTLTGSEQAKATAAAASYSNAAIYYARFNVGLQLPGVLPSKKQTQDYVEARLKSDPALFSENPNFFDTDNAQMAKMTSDILYRYRSLLGGWNQASSGFWADTLVTLAYNLQKPDAQREPGMQAADIPDLRSSLEDDTTNLNAVERVFWQVWATRLYSDCAAMPEFTSAVSGMTAEQLAQLAMTTSLYTKATRLKLFDDIVSSNGSIINSSTDGAIVAYRKLWPAREAANAAFNAVQFNLIGKSGPVSKRAYHAVFGSLMAPDATSDLRLSVGRVRGYEKDGAALPFATTFRTMFARARAMAGNSDFVLPTWWTNLESSLPLDTQLNIASTTDTTGGNSGSPVLNEKGEWIGVHFDVNEEAVANDLVYGDQKGRGMMTTAAAIRAALSAFGAASHVNELVNGRR